MNVVTCGQLESRAERYEEKEHTGKSVGKEEEIDCRTRHFSNCCLVFHSMIIVGMNAQKFADFLAQIRLNLDPDEQVVFIYDAPAHHNPGNPGPNTELKKLPPYSPF